MLAELGIDVQGIFKRSLAIMSSRLGANVLQELDLGGPLFFAALLGSVHLLVSLRTLIKQSYISKGDAGGCLPIAITQHQTGSWQQFKSRQI